MEFNDFDDFGIMPETTALRQKRGPKVRRSCEKCRASKGRCYPCDEDVNRCQRCFNDGKQCVFLEVKPRQRRAMNSRIRVAEMEEKLDDLMALLSKAQEAKSAALNLQAQETVITFAETNGVVKTFEASFSSPRLQNNKIFASIPSFPSPKLVIDNFNDPISKGIIEFSQADASVKFFQSNASNFPFVVVPPTMTLDTLRRQHPLLLLSILSFSAQSNFNSQKALELELRESLSRRVLVNGEKSLDILQGVLVYLAWYQFYFTAARQQIYQLCEMAAAMAVDLGVNKCAKDFAPARSAFHRPTPSSFLPKMSSKDMEQRRTFLGCYYLTSSICQKLRKPNNLKFGPYIDECANMLAQVQEAQNDHLLPYFIQMQRLCEEVNQAFDYGDLLHLPPLNCVRIEILVNAFEQQLKHFETTFPQEAWSNTSITMTYYALRIYVHEVGFHAPMTSTIDLVAGQLNTCSWYYSNSRNECLFSCLQSCKDYLDRFLQLPSEELISFTLPDFVHLVYAILILGAFTTECDAPTLDAGHVREIANMQHYLNELCNKIRQFVPVTKQEGGNDFLCYLHDMFVQTKRWHSRMLAEPTLLGYGIVRKREFSFMEIIPVALDRCRDFPVISEQAADEQWSDMFFGWSGSFDPVTMSLSTEMD